MGDEALYSLLTCGDSLSWQVPLVFFGVKFPDEKIITSHENICGYYSLPDFVNILNTARSLFPDRKNVVYISDNSQMNRRAKILFEEQLKGFLRKNPDYTTTYYNIETDRSSPAVRSVCYPRNAEGKIVVIPKWSPFMSFLGKNSKAPFFTSESLSLTQGAFCANDFSPLDMVNNVAYDVIEILLNRKTPAQIGLKNAKNNYFFDYKQIKYFNVPVKEVENIGSISNAPMLERYGAAVLVSLIILLIVVVIMTVWLVYSARKGAKKRKEREIEKVYQDSVKKQRDEFDNILQAIDESLIVYDNELNIRFANKSLCEALQLGDKSIRFYENKKTGTIIELIQREQSILTQLLEYVLSERDSITVPKDTYIKSRTTGVSFPISGEMVPVISMGKITGVAFTFKNISKEEMSARLFHLAVDDSAIFPWQYNQDDRTIAFKENFLQLLGFGPDKKNLNYKEIKQRIHPDDYDIIVKELENIIEGHGQNKRLIFRVIKIDGTQEWWETRATSYKGLSLDSKPIILGICMSVQRYKDVEDSS